jgi:hypothetical protein
LRVDVCSQTRPKQRQVFAEVQQWPQFSNCRLSRSNLIRRGGREQPRGKLVLTRARARYREKLEK